MTLSFGGGAGVLTIPGLTSDGLSPGGIDVAGGGLFAGIVAAAEIRANVGFAHVEQAAGQNFVHGAAEAAFVIDTIDSLSPDFTATIGGTTVTIHRAGLYLAVGEAYVASDVLVAGRIVADMIVSGGLIRYTFPCDAVNTDIGQAVNARLLLITSPPSTVTWLASQTDTVDRALSGELIILRLGSGLVP